MKQFVMGVVLVAFATAVAAEPELQLAWIFTDHAVLQQGMYLPVWGKAAPRSFVTAEFNGKTVTTQASNGGDFMLRLAPQKAGGPYTLSVRANNGTPVVIRDVMVGEVWLAGGQSNMDYQLYSDWSKNSAQPESFRKNCTNYKQLHEYLDTITPANTIRALRLPRQLSSCEETQADASWEIMDAAHAGNLSAVGAWFGRYVQEATGVTVGVITCTWGGSTAEAWISRSGLLANPATAGLVAESNRLDAEGKNLDQFRRNFLMNHHLADPGNQGFGKGWAKRDFDDGNWKAMNIPGSWIAQKIMGSGALWARKTVTIPGAWIGKELLLNLGPVDKHDVTYVNGVEVGRTGKDFDDQYWNVHRLYTVPAEAVTSRQLVIAIRAFSHYQDGSIGGNPDEYTLVLSGSTESIALAGEWRVMPEVDFGVHEYKTPSNLVPEGGQPVTLFESVLRPVIPYGIRGVIWYQGESNANTLERAKAYRNMLATLIRDWRYRWQEGDFPFIQMQLANLGAPQSYSETDLWCYLREAQQSVCKDLPNVYLASAIDIGEAEDIHPQNKKEAGRRMALVARKEVYGENIVGSGPVLKSFQREDSAMRLTFANADGMHFAGGNAKGFYVAGKDGKFVPADRVVIDGKTIVVSAEAIPEPEAVRYAWSNNPDGNLYNGAGLPAGSFRTDGQ